MLLKGQGVSDLINKQKQKRKYDSNRCKDCPPAGNPVSAFYYEQSCKRYRYQGNTENIAEVFPPSSRIVMQEIDLIENRPLAYPFDHTFAGSGIYPYRTAFDEYREDIP